MSDESVASPAKKRLKQIGIMDSWIKAGIKQSNYPEPKKEDCAIEMEPETKLVTIQEYSIVTEQGVSTETSTELFTTSVSYEKVRVSKDEYSKGKPLDQMQSLLNPDAQELVKVEPERTHTVLFKVPIVSNSEPEPHPIHYDDKWDSEHVKMPCSSNSLYPISVNGCSSLEPRWKLIKDAFNKKLSNSLELEKAILSYNSRYNHIWNLRGFHDFIDQLSLEEKTRFFDYTLPGIIRLAMELPERVTRPPILLVRNKPQSISLSQLQVASLLANAFLSTFPRRNTQKRQSEFSAYPDINFIKLFENNSRASWVYEKVKCLLNYFDRVSSKAPTGVITVTRQVVPESAFPEWETVTETFGGFYVSSKGTIEKEGIGLLQMDFANRFIGGGVLNTGCVQEEIRFVICPELLITCLFSEVMEPNEALIITGCEQYSLHSGYGDTFRFEGNFVDQTPCDQYGRKLCQVVAIDAIPFQRKETQYQSGFLRRELNKAYAGFYRPHSGARLTAVATGNWGCGAFRGDPRLKCLLQLMAAAVTRRDVVYFTFGDQLLRDDVFNMYSLLTEKKVTVGQLYSMLCQYGKQIGDSRSLSLDLYGYLYALLDTLDSDDLADRSSDASSNSLDNSRMSDCTDGLKAQ